MIESKLLVPTMRRTPFSNVLASIEDINRLYISKTEIVINKMITTSKTIPSKSTPYYKVLISTSKGIVARGSKNPRPFITILIW